MKKLNVYAWYEVAPRLAEMHGFKETEFQLRVDGLVRKENTNMASSKLEVTEACLINNAALELARAKAEESEANHFHQLTKAMNTSLATKLIQDIMTGTLKARDKDGIPLELPGTHGRDGQLSWQAARHAHLTKKEVNAWLKKNGRFEKFSPHKVISIPVEISIDFTVLATPDELIHAFGRLTGLNKENFRSLSHAPALSAARKVLGKSAKNLTTQPYFCPFEVMQWLIKSTRRSGSRLRDRQGWRILKSNFPSAYEKFSALDPADEYFAATQSGRG